MKLLLRLVINVAALFVVAYLIPGFVLTSIQAAVVAAIVIGVVNTFIKPIIQLIALPITMITFGIAAFLINVLLLYLISFIVPGFEISNFIAAIFASIVLSIVSWFLSKLVPD